jgi:hypothetical protein
MEQALIAGVGVEEFYRLTLGEINHAINAYQERERQSLISRVSAVLRGLGAAFAKKGRKFDAYEGLGVNTKQPVSQALIRRGGLAWLFHEDE